MSHRTPRNLPAIWIAVSLAVTPALAQSELGTSMKKHYRLRSVACHTCHVKEEEEKTRTALTEFGKVSARLLEGRMVTERLDAVEDAEQEEKDQVRDAIEEEFAEALKRLETMLAPTGKTWADTIRAGEVDGVKPRN